MSTPRDYLNATVPAGFTPAPGCEEDDYVTLWQHQGIDVSGMLSIGLYWEAGEGFGYTLDVKDPNRSYNLLDLKVAFCELDKFIRQAEQIEGA